MRKNIKNYTTEIKVEKTLMEIQSLLAAKGAEKIMIEYENNMPSGLSFLLATPHGQMPIKLPARIKNVEAVFLSHKNPKAKDDLEKQKPLTPAQREQAYRTSWRNIKDWIDAQLALIETEMVTIHEVFLPYVVMGNSTLYERFENGQLSLNAGE